MRGLSARLAANLLWLVLFSVGVVSAAFLTYASGVFFDDSYEVTVPMPEAGGVLPEQEVTVLGRAVGQVADVELSEEGVLLTLEISGDQQVPSESVVQVLRRSPIGEQSVDFQPANGDWTAAEPGSRIVPTEALIPAEVPVLLENTRRLFAAIDKDDLSTLVSELGTALDGRGLTLKQLNRNSLDLNRTLVAGIPEFERVIDASEVVLATLQEHRQALAASFTNAADLTDLLADQAPNFETLLGTGTTALLETEALVRDNQANLACLFDDVLSINDMMLGPSTWDGAEQGRYSSKLDEFEQALIRNRFFFHGGFYIVTQPDPTTGAAWQRINFTSDEAQGQPYDENRATPATRPGAACQTEAFGTGVNAVRQEDPQPPDATSPGIDYAPMVEASGGRSTVASNDSNTRPAPAAAPDGPLPATGSGMVLAPALVALSLWLRRKP